MELHLLMPNHRWKRTKISMKHSRCCTVLLLCVRVCLFVHSLSLCSGVQKHILHHTNSNKQQEFFISLYSVVVCSCSVWFLFMLVLWLIFRHLRSFWEMIYVVIVFLRSHRLPKTKILFFVLSYGPSFGVYQFYVQKVKTTFGLDCVWCFEFYPLEKHETFLDSVFFLSLCICFLRYFIVYVCCLVGFFFNVQCERRVFDTEWEKGKEPNLCHL